MPPPLQRFQSGPNAISQYHQFQSHGQHSSTHPPPMGGNPNYLNPNSGVNPFSGNNNLLALGGALNTGGGFNVGGDSGLASHAARMSFAHAGGVQQQQQPQPHHQHAAQQHGQHAQHAQAGQQHLPGQQHGISEHGSRAQSKGRIREVWKQNLEEEMAALRDLVEKYPFVAMDTEFPGVVSRPMGGFRGKSDYHYQCLRTNVDMLRVIQIGIALFDEDGEQPPARPSSTDSANLSAGGRRAANQGPFPYAWQFNFKFSLTDDMYNETSIESLQQAGIDFAALNENGIDPHHFASLLMTSGLVCFEDVRWISFHGGYDFGYLTKLLYCKQLPSDEVEFNRLMKLYFPSPYDVKHLLKHAIKMHNSGALTPSDPGSAEILQKFEQKSGLEHIAETLKIKRVGAAHQAGSDSLLTGRVFFELRKRIFNGEISDDHIGKIWGLGIPDYGIAGGMTVGQANQGETASPSQQNNGNGNGTHNGTPSTPNITAAAPSASNTPATNGPLGPMTPGGGGGVFGQFAFGGNSR